ncbi:MAG: tetratricopeptide repeat protein [Methanotrichaceae archaeon]|nr:tetratricopeptide repeat protein [Methanotrichaceae archaeon]
MRLIYAVFILLLALLMTSAQCQKTAKDWINKGSLLDDRGEYDETIKAYNGVIKDWDEIIRLNPSDLNRWVLKGARYDYVRHDNAIKAYEEAIKAYDEFIRLNPNDVIAWYNKGIALKTLLYYDDALKCFNETIRLDPNNAGAWTGKGVALLYSQMKTDDAFKCFNEAIRLNPNYAEAWINKGVVLRVLGKHDETIQALNKACKLSPDDPNIILAWIIKGDTFLELKKYKESNLAYENAIRLNSVDRFEWHSLGLGFDDLAEHYKDIGDNAKAIDYYRKSISCYERTIELNGGDINNPSGIDLEHNIIYVQKKLQLLIGPQG